MENPKSFAEFLLSETSYIFADEILSYGTTVWSIQKETLVSDGDDMKFWICIQEEDCHFHNVWRGEVLFNKSTLRYQDVTFEEKYGNGDVSLSRLIDPEVSPFFSVNTEFIPKEEDSFTEEERAEAACHRTAFNEKWVETQKPIFRRLIDENPCFSGFRIVSKDQYVGLEKMYAPPDRSAFWVYIEIEDAETFEDVSYYEVWFRQHENDSTEEEETFKHGYFSLEGVRDMIETMNRGEFNIDTAFEETSAIERET